MAEVVEDVTQVVGEGGDPTSPEPEKAPAPYDWHSDIHPDVKDDPIWKSTPDVKTLTKAYADANNYNVGAIKIPGKEATADDWNAFYRKLGRPESAEGYELPETLKEDKRAGSMRGVAHAAGLRPEQWALMAEGWSRLTGEDAKTQAASRDETIATLQGEWGAAYDRKIALAQRVINQFGGDELFARLTSNPIGNDTGFIHMMVAVAEAMAEEELISGAVEGTQTKEDAQKELDTLTLSRAYLSPREPGHAEAVRRATKLFEIVYN